MPFGRWRGFELEDLPPEYLQWLAKQNLREPLRAEVVSELERRRRISAVLEKIAADLMRAADVREI